MQLGWDDRTTRRVRDLPGDARICFEIEVRPVRYRNCGNVNRERLAFLAANPQYTKRFIYYVGRRCRSATVRDIANELHLDSQAVKELDNQYIRGQRARAGTPGPKVIGIDEISIRKGHIYRIVVTFCNTLCCVNALKKTTLDSGPLRRSNGSLSMPTPTRLICMNRNLRESPTLVKGGSQQLQLEKMRVADYGLITDDSRDIVRIGIMPQ